jgi:Gamma-glutamyl cyclotransferase, AIG2-like
MRFFFYGILLDRDVIALALGRRLPPNAFVRASLPGHARRRIKGGSYPIVVRDPRGEVAGAVVTGLSVRDVARLSAFEGPRYWIVPLKVKVDGRFTIVSGQRGLGAPVMAASAQAPVRRPRAARLQRAPGVFHAVTWSAEQ